MHSIGGGRQPGRDSNSLGNDIQHEIRKVKDISDDLRFAGQVLMESQPQDLGPRFQLARDPSITLWIHCPSLLFQDEVSLRSV